MDDILLTFSISSLNMSMKLEKSTGTPTGTPTGIIYKKRISLWAWQLHRQGF